MRNTTSPNSSFAPFWDAAYAKATQPDTFSGGVPSAQIVEVAAKLQPGATILDIGCGDGRNALYLAEQGFAVTAVDISEAATDAVQRFAQARDVMLTTEVLDMRSYMPNTLFDFIIAEGCLHLVEREYWSPLVDRLKEATAPGGYNDATVFTDTLPLPSDMIACTRGLFHEGELFTLYDGWTIHLQTSYQFDDEHPGSVKHRHAVNKLVAQKIL
ncbi:MAG: methyltransferase domain-containing protein [Armatimonadota bacterium]